MSIKVHIFYPQLKQLTAGRDPVLVNGGTVGDCLKDLMERFPGADKLLFDESGQLLKHVFVYVNAESARKADPADPVRTGDTLIIAVLLTAG